MAPCIGTFGPAPVGGWMSSTDDGAARGIGSPMGRSARAEGSFCHYAAAAPTVNMPARHTTDHECGARHESARR